MCRWVVQGFRCDYNDGIVHIVAGPRAAAVASVGAATVVGAYGLITSVSMPSISDVTERARDMFKSKPKEDKTSLADYEKEFVSEKKKV